MIKQGSEDPITLTFNQDMEGTVAFIAVLTYLGKTIKEYSLEDVKIDGNSVELPLTQEETLKFPYGQIELEVTWRDAEGIKYMADREKIYVAPREIKKTI